MSTVTSNAASSATVADVHEHWDAPSPACGEYERDCMAIAAEALAHVGFSHVDATPWEDVLSCMEGDLPVTVAVMCVPSEGFAMTLKDLEGMCDRELATRGASLCAVSAIMADAPVPEHTRFDVMSVCLLPEVPRARVHHVRGVWQA